VVKKNNSLRQAPHLSLIRGEQVNATYREQPIPEYQGNPLIEALPRLWTMGEVEQMLSYFPPYDPEQIQLADEVRLHLLENAREFFISQGIHYEIHLSVSNMLRRGYIDRNPIKYGTWTREASKVEQLKHNLQRRAFLRSKARGLCIVGIGGVGKSTAVENILSLYPQVITHTNYRGQDFIQKQLVWVKLQCPSDGSLRGLCINYLEEVDDILGTNYIRYYGVGRRNVDELLVIMARVASIHFLGVIAFDEIQDLSEAKSGGATRMLNFFVQLENTLGIPFILIGTPKAKALLSGEFRQARRISEQGDIYWRPMREIAEKQKPSDPDVFDPDCNDFVRAMWKYWYLRKSHPLPADLLQEPVIRTLYEESKGITALVVTIFFLAQRRAITSGEEDLTKSVIKSAVKDNQYFVDQVLTQFREQRQSKRSPRVVSDLDRSAWQWPKASPGKPESEEPSRKASTDGSNQKPPKPKDNRPSTTKPGKNRTEKHQQSFEPNDYRALSVHLAGGDSDSPSTGGESPFGSTNEFS
jgi:AAA domain